MYELFDVPWESVALNDVQALLDESEPEPLVWEAKGQKLPKPDEVRRQIGAFANSSEGGYLILGASDDGDCWKLDGIRFPDGEPPRFVSSCLQHNIRPRPIFDVRTWSVGDDAEVAIVRVYPLEAGPCIVGGTVHERVPGAVLRVTDPTRLADLIARGRRAHLNASQAASEAPGECFPELPEPSAETVEIKHDDRQLGPLYLSVAVASLAPTPDIGSRLFRESTRECMTDLVQRLSADGSPIHPTITPSVRQDRRVVTASTLQAHRPDWALVALWNGAAAISIRANGAAPSANLLVSEFIVPAYPAVVAVVNALGGSDTGYLQVFVQQANHPALDDGVAIGRGPVALDPERLDRESLAREISRSLGIDDPEPEARLEIKAGGA